MFNILVYTVTSFNFKCGGLVVQYEFCRVLEKLGINVKISAPEKIQNSIFCKYYNNDFDLNNTVVIYGETIEGNPLKAPYVIRWILAPLGSICKPNNKTWGSNDLVYYFNSDNKFYNNDTLFGTVYKTLTTIYINPLINNYNDPLRKGYCHTFRKTQFHKKLKYVHHPNSQEIKREDNVIQCINIFNKREIFISYDPLTFLNIIAAMCGCISVVIKIDGLTEIEWLKTTAAYPYLKANNLNKIYGIAYGLSEVEWAKNTLPLVKQQWIDICEFMKQNTVIPFLDDIKNLDNIKCLVNTVKNNYG
jgi:hypothetical protein